MNGRGPQWPPSEYDRSALPERVLQFGTGMLLRAICAAAVDRANRGGAFNGRIAMVQSTTHDNGRMLNRQQGLFTLVERGIAHGASVERTRLVGSISRVLDAGSDWATIRDVATRPELQVIVSNVTESGFTLADPGASPDLADDEAPHGFPARLLDLLLTRFRSLPNGPPVWVIPTELVPDNGKVLAGLIMELTDRMEGEVAFKEWLATNVRFCSSLVDRITTGAPDDALRGVLESQLGYHDEMLTITEPYALWAIEADPHALRAVFPMDAANDGTVIFAADISFYRERKLRLLNGVHTALAPLALRAGIRTVRSVVAHPHFGPFLRQLLFDEIAPSTSLAPEDAKAFGQDVIERFGNPSIEHEWRVIAMNQVAKFRLRVVPSIVGYCARSGRIPPGLALALAATLWYEHAATGILADPGIWGTDLAAIPGLRDAVAESLALLERIGSDAAVKAGLSHHH